MKQIHERLEEARLKAGYETVTEAAEALGVKYPTYAGHENGTTGLRLEPAMKYARKFKVSLDWLVTGKGRGPESSGAWEIFLMIADLDLSASDIDYLKQSVEYVKRSGRAA